MWCGDVKNVGIMKKLGCVVAEYWMQLSRTLAVRMLSMHRMQI